MEQSGRKEILKNFIDQSKKAGCSIGFVPTMGALHQGHLDLIAAARRQNSRVVVSIFVNPLQFNNAEDLKHYPRQPEADAGMLRQAGVDFLFIPDAEEFYPEKTNINLDFGETGRNLEGAMRPGHFSGVGVVLARLFHLVQADRAYFGAKDLQQVAVVKMLVRDLGFPIEIIRCPTRREKNGLAMSSRNQRLSAEGREMAANLFKALEIGVGAGTGDLKLSRSKALQYLAQFPGIELEYLEWVDANTMEILTNLSETAGEPALCIAARVEGIRLIDNLIAGN